MISLLSKLLFTSIVYLMSPTICITTWLSQNLTCHWFYEHLTRIEIEDFFPFLSWCHCANCHVLVATLSACHIVGSRILYMRGTTSCMYNVRAPQSWRQATESHVVELIQSSNYATGINLYSTLLYSTLLYTLSLQKKYFFLANKLYIFFVYPWDFLCPWDIWSDIYWMHWYQKANGIIHRSYQMMFLHFIFAKEILFPG